MDVNGVICRVDIGILLADSSSISSSMWTAMINFVKKLADFVNISENGPHFGLTTYGFRRAAVRIKLNQYTNLSAFEDALDDMKRDASGGDALWLGIDYTLHELFNEAEGARRGIPKAIILLTDGECNACKDTDTPNNNSITLSGLANEIRTAGHKMFVIGVGKPYTEMAFHIEQFVDETSFFRITDYDNLLDNNTLFQRLAAVCDGTLFNIWLFKILCEHYQSLAGWPAFRQ